MKGLEEFCRMCRGQAETNRQAASGAKDEWLKGYAQGGAATLDWVVSSLELLSAVNKKEATEVAQANCLLNSNPETEEVQETGEKEEVLYE